jgi:hypothetical protein
VSPLPGLGLDSVLHDPRTHVRGLEFGHFR